MTHDESFEGLYFEKAIDSKQLLYKLEDKVREAMGICGVDCKTDLNSILDSVKI